MTERLAAEIPIPVAVEVIDGRSDQLAVSPVGQAVGSIALAEKRTAWREARARQLQTLVDPDYSLPAITLVTDTTSEQARASARTGITIDKAIDADGNEVGQLQTHRAKYTDDIVQVFFSRVTKKGEGYGTAMYLAAAQKAVRQGKILMNDQSGVSKDAKDLWERLAASGAATVRTGFKRDPLRVGETYQGRYVILPYS